MSLLSIVTWAVPDGKVAAWGGAGGGGREHAPILTTISPVPSPAANRFHTSPPRSIWAPASRPVLRNVASCRPGRWLIAALGMRPTGMPRRGEQNVLFGG